MIIFIDKKHFFKNIFQNANKTQMLKITALLISFLFLIWLNLSIFGYFHIKNNSKKKTILKVGVNNNSAPNVFKVLEQNEGKKAKKAVNSEYIAGFDIDLINNIADKLDLELEFHVFDFAGLLNALEQETIDIAVASLSITDKRKEKYDVSKAYMQTGTSIVVRNKRFDDLLDNLRKQQEPNNNKEIKINYNKFCQKLKDLGKEKPIKFITFLNTVAIPVIEKIKSDTNKEKEYVIKNNELTSSSACFTDILQGKSDMFITDNCLARWACEINQDLTYFDVHSDNLEHSTCPQGLGIFFPKKNDEDRRIPNLQEKINAALVKLDLVKKDEKGEFQDIIDLKKKNHELKETSKEEVSSEDKNKIEEIEKKVKKRLDEVFNENKETIELPTKKIFIQAQKTIPSYLKGLKTTLILAIDSLIVGFLLAIICTLIKNIKLDYHKNNFLIVAIIKILNTSINALFFVLKGIPVAAQAMLIYYSITFLFKGNFNPLHTGIFVLILNSLASITMILMQNIKFLDKGQIEAAHSLGMNQKQVFLSIVFPQTLKRSVPFILQQLITNIKDSSFFAIIGVAELSWKAQSNMGATLNPILPFVMISCFYLIIISMTGFLSKMLEKNIKLKK
ncbi:ABC-type amino acid ABC transporter, permease protein [Maize bushy stunt phytoplasma]|uniref:ABC-type amino acid ABC transporter, permease protein n=2 Tax=16SrI (Aster yellows group) TaxID=3042590 RepID=A0ABN4RYF6_9MOLU|nr:transporter substrate-binding domain-containing protein [Maize bushy stunt phytoplasma]AOF54757.1 ABC-type amino acid ABC transporter, permease protein [Maize bushy stunt phytoplasma]